jgi:hypothetical protein
MKISPYSTLLLLLLLTFCLLTCSKDHDPWYPNAKGGQLLVQIYDLHPADLDSVVFRFTNSDPIKTEITTGNAVILDIRSAPLGQYLTEIVVYSRINDPQNDPNLRVKRLDILNTRIFLRDPSQSITISGSKDKKAGWIAFIEAHYDNQPEALEVQVLPLTSFVRTEVNSLCQVQNVILTKTAAVAGFKGTLNYFSFEKTYTSQEFYQKSTEGQKMYDSEGFMEFNKKLEKKGVRKMTYQYKVQYSDGSTRTLRFNVHL